MFKYIIKRLLWMIPVVLGVLSIVFILSEITSGDPVDAIVGYDAPIEVREAKREELGLNDPVAVRFISYIVKVVTRRSRRTRALAGVLTSFCAFRTLYTYIRVMIVAWIIQYRRAAVGGKKCGNCNASMAFCAGVSIPHPGLLC